MPARTEHDSRSGGSVLSTCSSCVVESLGDLPSLLIQVDNKSHGYLASRANQSVCFFSAVVADHKFSDVGILSV